MMIKTTLLLFVFTLILLACKEENPVVEPDVIDIIEPDDDEQEEVDDSNIILRELKEGIFLRCDSLKDSYNLDEPLSAIVYLENKSNEEGLHIVIGNFPPYLSWRITDSNNKLIIAEPSIIGFIDYEDSLKVGEILSESLSWHHHIWDPNDIYSGLKAYSGIYDLRISFRGVDNGLDPYLTKKIEILEDGEPLSGHLHRYHDAKDSINYDFILRNRITKDIELTASESPSFIYFFDDSEQDTVFTHSFQLENQKYKLSGHSDTIITEFRYPKQYFLDSNINGAFDIIIVLNFVERQIINRKLFFIL